MKLPPKSLWAALLAAALLGTTLALPKAQAFTVENQGATNADGTARYNDPDRKFEQYGQSGSRMNLGNGVFMEMRSNSSGNNSGPADRNVNDLAPRFSSPPMR